MAEQGTYDEMVRYLAIVFGSGGLPGWEKTIACLFEKDARAATSAVRDYLDAGHEMHPEVAFACSLASARAISRALGDMGRAMVAEHERTTKVMADMFAEYQTVLHEREQAWQALEAILEAKELL